MKQGMSRRRFLGFSTLFGILLSSLSLQIDRVYRQRYDLQSGVGLDLRQFLQLSQAITGKENLSQEVGEQILGLFNSDLRSKKALVQLYQELYPSSNHEIDLKEMVLAKVFAGMWPTPKKASEIKQKILSAWYTGIVSVSGKRQRVTYFGALHHQCTEEIKNIPSSCGGEMGFWRFPPELTKS
jgi:hypothetical protein